MACINITVCLYGFNRTIKLRQTLICLLSDVFFFFFFFKFKLSVLALSNSVSCLKDLFLRPSPLTNITSSSVRSVKHMYKRRLTQSCEAHQSLQQVKYIRRKI